MCFTAAPFLTSSIRIASAFILTAHSFHLLVSAFSYLLVAETGGRSSECRQGDVVHLGRLGAYISSDTSFSLSCPAYRDTGIRLEHGLALCWLQKLIQKSARHNVGTVQAFT